jgi:hypothetical protein
VEENGSGFDESKTDAGVNFAEPVLYILLKAVII